MESVAATQYGSQLENRQELDLQDIDHFRSENLLLREQLSHCQNENAQLQDEIATLQSEIARLQIELTTLRLQARYWQSMHGRAAEREREHKEKINSLQGETRKLKDEQFGKRSEKQSRKDRSNSLGESPKTSSRKRGQQPSNPGPKRKDYSHLPKRTRVIELPECQRCCSSCGQPFREMSDAKVSEQIELEVQIFRQELIRKRYRRTCQCPECPSTVTAPTPAKLIPKGRLGSSIWTEILLSKYHDHCSTGRLIERLRLHGLPLAPGTITGGLKMLEPLFGPIYDAICERNKQSGLHQADETRWMVFVYTDEKTSQRWWLWVFLGVDTIVFRLAPTRCHNVPEQHYCPDTSGVLMVDRYSAYKAMAQVKLGSFKLAFCWSHVRRDFVRVGKGWEELKPWALAWLERIRLLYAFNRDRVCHDDDSDAFAAAEIKLREHVEQMRQQYDSELSDPKLREPARKALESLNEHWEGLTLFVDDFRIPMDNNRSERMLRGPATGRKNYYGSACKWSGRLAAVLFTIFATLQQWGINPRTWLTLYFAKCAELGGNPPDNIDSFLPWNLSSQEISKLGAPPESADFDSS